MTDLVYSKSTAGGVKRVIDLGIMGMRVSNSDRIDLKKEDYLKDLIRVSSNNTIEVQKLSSGLQFFFIIGGAEGFLDKSYETVDASRIEAHGTNTHGATTTIAVDDTCLLAVFDHLGTFVSSAVLRRPLIVKSPPVNWEESDATAVVAAWDKAKVGIYRNENFEVKYYGIWVNDFKSLLHKWTEDSGFSQRRGDQRLHFYPRRQHSAHAGSRSLARSAAPSAKRTQ